MAAMSTYYPMIYDFLVEQARTTNTNQSTHHAAPPPSPTRLTRWLCALQGLSKAAAALKAETKINAKSPRSGGSLAEALKLSGAKRLSFPHGDLAIGYGIGT